MQIQEAYETLSDDGKRAQYDQFGSADPSQFHSQHQGFHGGAQGFGGGQGFDIFNELFRNFGGQGGGQFRGSPFGGGFESMDLGGADIETSMNISFMDAVKGAQKPLSFTSIQTCSTCSGSGLKTGKQPVKCGACHGTGQQTFSIRGGFQMSAACSACGGTGETIPKSHQCSTCAGKGRVRQRKSVIVNIPAGIQNGMKVRLAGQGDAAPVKGGPAGDLFVEIRVCYLRFTLLP